MLKHFPYGLLGVAAVIGLICMAPVTSHAAEAEKPSVPKKYALLVGISGYAKKPLTGPKNDITLVWGALHDKLGFAKENIVVLADKVGKPEQRAGVAMEERPQSKGRPEYKRIIHELKRLLKIAKKGDLVLFYYSGHGAYFPDDRKIFGTDRPDAEPDGLDEVLLPIDHAVVDEKLTNVISDDELRLLLEDTDANVWLVIDACHAGDLTRGAGTNYRFVDPIGDLGLPQSVFDNVKFRKTTTRSGATSGRKRIKSDASQWVASGQKNVVSFSAVPSDSVALERPIAERNGRIYGVFTHSFVDAVANSAPATYRGLSAEIARRIQLTDQNLPTPVFEGPLDRGFDPGKRNSSWLISVGKDGGLTINTAGMLDGIEVGAILAVQPGKLGAAATAQATPKPLTHMKVTKVGLKWSEGVLTDFDKVKLPSGAKRIGLLKKIAATPHNAQLRQTVNFSLRVTRPARMSGDDDDWQLVTAAVKRLERETEQGKGLPITWLQADPEACGDKPGGTTNADLYLCYRKGSNGRNGHIELLPSWIDFSDLEKRPIPRLAVAKSIDDDLKNALWKVLRSWNLLRLASVVSPNKKLANAIDVELKIARGRLIPRGETPREKGLDCGQDAPVKPPRSLERFDPPEETSDTASRDIVNVPDLSHCDLLYIQVHNRGDKRLDLTLLYFDTFGGIQPFPIHPRLKSDGELAEWVRIAIFTWCSKAICTGRDGAPKPGYQPLGAERLMIIAVERDDANAADIASFAYLAQSGLDAGVRERRTRGAPLSRGEISSFESLLRDAALSPGKTRGAPNYRNATIKTIKWRLVPLRTGS